jgi:MoaA/NifB/PqqE/SkfB family radical SAM enzyme
MFARAMQSDAHPILAQVVPIRRCNLDCAYCNEYDKTSDPVPLATMLGRIDRLADLGTTIITLSGGEPTLHPDLDAIIARIRERGAIATLITNGLLLTPERIQRLNRAGLDYLQISIDNAHPDEISKKSLQVLDRKLEWLGEHAEFGVTINSVLGTGIRKPEDALQVALRARSLGFTSTVGILHDHSGQLQPLGEAQRTVYEQFMRHKDSLFSFAHFDSFQQNISRGLPNDWHCRAGGRFLYICEDGLVHYCSQQRGKPGIPLENYGLEDLRREAGNAGRDTGAPPGSLSHFRAPAAVRALAWMFLDAKRRGFFGKLMLAALGIKGKPATADFDGP